MSLRLGISKQHIRPTSRSLIRYDARAVCQRGISRSCNAMRESRKNLLDPDDQWGYPIYTSNRLKDRKSVFLAHASTIPTAAALKDFLSHLASLPDLKKATHCMYAYRIVPDPDNPSFRVIGQHDGGEKGSGERLTRLLEALECENVVVVSRWYGGVKLGSDRWKLISTVAKEALHRGYFVKDDEGINIIAKPVKPDVRKKGK